jgi:MFS family permease
VTGFAVLVGAVAALGEQPVAGALALLACAALVTGAAVLPEDDGQRTLLLIAPVPLLALAATGLAQPELALEQLAVVPALVAVLAAVAAALVAALVGQRVPSAWRHGPAVGAALVALVALAAVAGPALAGLAVPFGWLADPWSAPAGASARSGLPRWTGPARCRSWSLRPPPPRPVPGGRSGCCAGCCR